MNLKIKYLLKKLLACACLVGAIALFFTGWISVRSNKYTKEIKQELREAEEELKDLESDFEDYQEMLEEMADEMDVNIKFSFMDAYETIEDAFDMIKDLSLSPKELVSFFPMINKVNRMMEKVQEIEMYDDSGYAYGPPVSPLGIVNTALGAVGVIFIILIVLFVVTIALEVLHIVLYILNKKGVGVAIIPFQVIWLLVGVAPVVIGNIVAKEEIGVKVVQISVAPFAALALVIVSCIVWSMAQKDLAILNIQGDKADPLVDVNTLKGKAEGLKNKVSDMAGKIASQTSAGTVKCPSCGKECAKGTLFCIGCGTKLQQEEEKAFCMNCGQQISATATFCNHCGAKVER